MPSSTNSRRIASMTRRASNFRTRCRLCMIRRSQPLAAAHCHQVHVEAYFRDGSVERETRDAPRGSEQCFAGEAQIVEKFRKLTGSVMARALQDALVEAVLRLDELADSRAMTKLLRVG